jgi:hypothetical protein
MKLIIKAATIGFAVLALGACNKHTEEGQNVIDNTENVTDNMQATTDNTTDAMMNSAENKADAIDNSVKAANAADANASSNSSK